MSTSTITRVRDLVTSNTMTRAGLARAAGLHANTLRDCTEDTWNPTAETLAKLDAFLEANADRIDRPGKQADGHVADDDVVATLRRDDAVPAVVMDVVVFDQMRRKSGLAEVDGDVVFV